MTSSRRCPECGGLAAAGTRAPGWTGSDPRAAERWRSTRTIAHDLNNLFSVILGQVALSRGLNSDASPPPSGLEEIEIAVKRATELTRLLLGTNGEATSKQCDVNSIVGELQRVLHGASHRRITAELCEGPACVGVSCTNASRVVMNLLLNAAEATGPDDAIVVGTQRVLHADANGLVGDWIELTVRDEGRGMDARTRSDALEPGFTHKKSHGHGLGLESVRSIVESHGGSVNVHSRLDVGTRVRILLPTVAPEQEKPPHP